MQRISRDWSSSLTLCFLWTFILISIFFLVQTIVNFLFYNFLFIYTNLFILCILNFLICIFIFLFYILVLTFLSFFYSLINLFFVILFITGIISLLLNIFFYKWLCLFLFCVSNVLFFWMFCIRINEIRLIRLLLLILDMLLDFHLL
jgi:hypothetical protein